MNKQEALNNALAMIEKQFGKWSIMKLWDEWMKQKVETFSSGSLSLDLALGGWYAKWRIVEIYWPESSGKTTLTLHAIAEIQKAGWVAAFIDAEHALDPEYARKIWVDTDNLLISQPDYGEQALEITEKLVNSWAVDLIIVDSVAALTPKAEIEWEMWDSHMWLQARLMSQALRKITWAISRTNCTVIFINQIRMKIWVMFGSPETTTWGNALKFYASQRLDIRRKGKIETWAWMEKEVTGSETTVKVIKNKIAPPFRTGTFPLMFDDRGIFSNLCLWNMFINKKMWEKHPDFEKSGSWFSWKNERIGQGSGQALKFLCENPDVLEDMKETFFGKKEEEE